MTNFKVGDKVRILSLDAPLRGFKIGDEVVIKQSKLDGSKEGGAATYSVTNGKAYGYCDAIHIELVNAQPTKKQRISTLETQVAELKASVEALKQAQSKSTDIGNTAAKLAELVEGETVTPRKKASLTPNELRKVIIAEARAFVAKVEAQVDSALADRTQGNYTYQDRSGYVKYNVNAEKRTVVALVYDKYSDNLNEKAIAKCAPTDVFNADIGKAIALGRALGLDVSKFEQAVQPTEVVVGQAIKSHTTLGNPFEYRNVTSVDGGRIYGFDTRRGSSAFMYANAAERYGDFAKIVITDDTEAQYA